MAHRSPKRIEMSSHIGQQKRVLALEIRTRKLGFAVLEGPTILLDWGMRSFDRETAEDKCQISDRLSPLLAFHQPLVLVVGVRNYHSPMLNRTFRRSLHTVRSEAKRMSVRLRVLPVDQMRAHFATKGLITKHDIAARLAMQFEELSWKLPRRRKSYHSESRAMLVFDALAIGIAFFTFRFRTRTDRRIF